MPVCPPPPLGHDALAYSPSSRGLRLWVLSPAPLTAVSCEPVVPGEPAPGSGLRWARAGRQVSGPRCQAFSSKHQLFRTEERHTQRRTRPRVPAPANGIPVHTGEAAPRPAGLSALRSPLAFLTPQTPIILRAPVCAQPQRRRAAIVRPQLTGFVLRVPCSSLAAQTRLSRCTHRHRRLPARGWHSRYEYILSPLLL